GRVAEALEAVHAARVDDVCDRLAHHYAEAGNHAKAVTYLTRVGDRAGLAYASDDALAILGRALDHAGALPDDQRERATLDIHVGMGHALWALGRIQEAFDKLLALERTAERAGDPAITGPYYVAL